MSDIDVKKLRELLDKATPRPWKHDGNVNSPWMWSTLHRGGLDKAIFKCGSVADADLIVAAVNALPDLLATIERLEGELNHAISENLAFNVKVSHEINEARSARDTIERRTMEHIATWLEGYEDEPVDARIAAQAIRDWKWRPR